MIEKIYKDNSEVNFDQLWEDGLIVFDSNVLLDLYRLPLKAKDDLLNIFRNEKINKNIWIPFQVKLEFLNNRHNAIADQKAKFQTVRSIISNAISQYDEVVNEMKDSLKKLKLKERHSLIEPDKYLKNKKLNKGKKNLEKFIKNLNKLEKDQIDVHEDDKLKKEVLDLFHEKSGSCLESDKIQEIYKEGEIRYKKELPPGYKDSTKKGSYYYGEIELIRKFGDLIVWNEIIEKAEKEKLKYLILVTGDVKEDWWYIKRGKRLGPKYELLNEIYSRVPSLETFYMYDTSAFMRYAKEKLELNVEEESIKELEYLIEEIRRIPTVKLSNRISNISDVLNEAISVTRNLGVVIKGPLNSLPIVSVSKRVLFSVFMEILSNVKNHGNNNVKISIFTTRDEVIISFKNKIKTKSKRVSDRNRGLSRIYDILSKEKGKVKIHWNEKHFTVDLMLPIYTMTNNKYDIISTPSS